MTAFALYMAEYTPEMAREAAARGAALLDMLACAWREVIEERRAGP